MSRVAVVVLLLGCVAWAEEPAPGPRKFSDAFYERRALEQERLKPSWRDAIAVAASAWGGAQVSTDRSLSVLSPTVTLGFELGGHFNPSVALVGTGLLEASFQKPGTELVALGAGVGVRLGSRHTVTFGGGAAYLVLSRVSTTNTGFAPVVDVRGVIQLVDRFGLHLRAGAIVTPAGVFLDLGVGFGLST